MLLLCVGYDNVAVTCCAVLDSSIDKFMNFMYTNIGLITADSHYQDQQLKHLRGGYPLLVEHFDGTGVADTRQARHSCSIRWFILGGWASSGGMGFLRTKRRNR